MIKLITATLYFHPAAIFSLTPPILKTFFFFIETPFVELKVPMKLLNKAI